MIKTINKKVVSFLMILVLLLCCLVVPASAADVESDEGYVAEGVSITRIGDVASPRWGGTIDSIMLDELTVRAFGGYNSKGQIVEIEVNDSYGYAAGPTSWLYCALSDPFYKGMINAGLNRFVCHLTFSVYGTDVTRYIVKVDDTVIVDKPFMNNGEYTVTWTSPLKMDTEFCVIAETISTKATVWGRYRADCYYDEQ